MRIQQLKGDALAYALAKIQGRKVEYMPTLAGEVVHGYWVRIDWRTWCRLSEYVSPARISALKRTYKVQLSRYSDGKYSGWRAVACMYSSGATSKSYGRDKNTATVRAILAVNGFEEFEVPDGVGNEY